MGDETVRVSRYEADRIYSVCYYDRSQQYYYMKRFTAEMSDKMQFFLDEEGQADLVAVTERTGAKLEITYKGAHASRPADEIDVDEFVGVKSHRAKGKRLTTYDVAALRFIEPELPPEPEPSDDDGDDAPDDTPSGGGASGGAQGGFGNGADNRAVGGSNGDAADRGAIDAAALSGGIGSAVSSGANSATEGPAFAPASSAAETPSAPGVPAGSAPARNKPAADGVPAAKDNPAAKDDSAVKDNPAAKASAPKKTPASPAGLPRTGTTSGGVEFEIERAKGDADEVIDPEQLNLF